MTQYDSRVRYVSNVYLKPRGLCFTMVTFRHHSCLNDAPIHYHNTGAQPLVSQLVCTPMHPHATNRNFLKNPINSQQLKAIPKQDDFQSFGYLS